MFTNEQLNRFWRKVQIPFWGHTCFLWTGATVGKLKHGSFRVNDVHWYAHRLSWTITYGRIPEGMFVCHKCDVPRCVNPAHLFLGTQTDNMRDAANKKRLGRTAKISLDLVSTVKIERSKGRSWKSLGNEYGVSAPYLSRICRGKVDRDYLNKESR